MKSATDPCWTCGMETRHLFLTFRGTRNRNSFAVGGAEALNVKMDLDHLQKESAGGAAHGPSVPVIPLRSDPAAVTAVLSLPSHPPHQTILSGSFPANRFQWMFSQGKGRRTGRGKLFIQLLCLEMDFSNTLGSPICF